MAFAPSSNPKPLSPTAPLAKPFDGSRQRSQSQSQPPDSKSTISSSHPNPPVHKRVYQACIPCRRRKVRCDLGSVDNPHDPPCVRCRRESKECFFSATRRKRKADDPDGDIESDEYVIRNGRKRLQADPLPLDRSIYGGEIPLTPGGSLGRREPLRRPDGRGGRANREFSSGGEDSNAPLANLEAQEVMRDRVYGQHDALDLLYKAATDRFVHHRSPSTTITTTVTNTTANSITAAVISSSSSTIATSQYASQTPTKPPTTATSPWRGTFTAPPEASVALSMVSGLQEATATAGRPGFHSGVGVPAGSAPSGSSLFAAAATASSLFPLDYEGFGANLDLRRGSPTISARPEPSRAASVTGSNIATPAAGHLRKHSKVDGPMLMPMSDQGARGQPPLNAEDALEEALKSWGRFRFVRAGWFTAQEAIAYIDYYYTYLSPLTPISPPTFRNPASHTTLLSEEPILTVTLLTITSRYMKLSGPGGHCRSNAIHEQLWTYLRGMIERCLWGQEAFGGRLHPSGPTEDFQTSSTAPWRGLRKGSLRTLGTIESLMILTEWHPRALHFPPAEAIDELMLPSYEATLQNDAEQRQFHESGSFGGKRIESWLEPAWRSDRMCWMLLSTAMGLAYELGVFDNIDELLRDGAVPRPEYEEEGYRQRAYRIKRLLLIYLTQLAGRLGWKNMVPEQLWKSDPAVSRKRRDTVEGMTPASHGSLANTFNYIPDLELDDQIIHCWAGVSNTMHIGNERLFKSRKHTTEIIQSGLYVDLLREFQPMLHNWWNEFDRFRLPPYIRHILTIEYEYVRIYINSLSLQAVVERCTNNAGNHTVPTTVASTDTGDASTTGTTSGAVPQLSPQTQNYYGKLPLGQLGGLTQADQVYIREVVDGCRNLLRTVVDGLLPKGYLKHAPVRTYFRIISGAMFLLKTFALGAPRSDVKISIRLMDEAVEALRNCVVDDVHLGVRFADLLETLTSRLRTRFIQAPVAQTNGAAVNTKDGQQPTATTITGYPPGQPKVPESTSPAVAIIATPFNMPFPVPSSAAAPNHNASGNLNPNTVDVTTTATLDGAGLPVNPSGVAVPPPVVPSTVTGFKDWTTSDDMWYLPPGAAFFQNMENNNVQMTAEGINVGGADLLDYMMDFPNIDGSAATFQ